MAEVLNSPLLGAPSCLDDVAVIGTAQPWTWRRIHAASIAFARELGEARSLCNLCTSKVGFLVTWLAALRSGRMMVLPPSGGRAEIEAVVAAGFDSIVVVDDAGALADRRFGNVPLRLCVPQTQAGAADADLSWHPAWDRRAVDLFTSGSTGRPERQPKTLRQLVAGAAVLGSRLAQELHRGLGSIRGIVCSVPQQHMFGFECSVMLPLAHGIPVLERRPLLPADVIEAFHAAPGSAWIATPLHLRSLVQTRSEVLHCAAVVASTMPLARPLAQQTEALVAAPLLEIYGSTETGVVAMRRTAREASWQPVAGVQIQADRSATTASGSHFTSPRRLPDLVEVHADGSFTLLGRHADLVKIAGRRASLAGLNQFLQDLPGLDDGVFYLPAAAGPTERLCVVYSGPAIDAAQANRWLGERIDPVFLPRTWIRVDRLPRNDSGKLSRAALDQAFEAWHAAAATGGPPGPDFVVPTADPAVAGGVGGLSPRTRRAEAPPDPLAPDAGLDASLPAR